MSFITTESKFAEIGLAVIYKMLLILITALLTCTGISLSSSSPTAGKTENTSVKTRTAFDAFVSVPALVADEEDRSLHDRKKTGISEALPPSRIHSV